MDDLYFDIATKLHFGIDTVSLLGVTVRETGSRAMLVYDPVLGSNGILDKAVMSLEEAGISPILFDEAGPFATSRCVEKGIELASKGQIQTVIGLGGVSTLSYAKAIAGCIGKYDRLDPVFGKNEIDVTPIKFIGLPTSIRDPFMLTPRVLLVDARNRIPKIISMKDFSTHTVIVDPRLCSHLSNTMLNSVGVDLLLQSIEGYFSTPSNFITQSLFLRAIDIGIEFLAEIASDGISENTLVKACQAGLLSALGFSMGRLGMASAVGFAAKGLHQVPSSSVSTIMLPYMLEYAKSACPDKLLRIGPIINSDVRSMGHSDAVDAIVDAFRVLVGKLDLPLRLSLYGIEAKNLPLLARSSADIGINGYLPVSLTTEEILAVLKQAL